MQPTKRRDSSNHLLGGSPAKRVPEPPASDDDSDNKASLLKAFEAVVAAGRRGLLGPTAMAAVEAMPDLELECRDGKAGQETTSLLEEKEETVSLLEEKEEEKKAVHEECNAVVAVTPPVMDTASSQDTTKEIWICGDSVISLSRTRARSSCHGIGLGFSPSVAYIHWHAIPTMLWDHLLPILHGMYLDRPFPSIIIIHVGENDLGIDSSSSIVTSMQNDLNILQSAFPDVVIIWSSLLPKRFGRPHNRCQIMESTRNKVNCKMEEYCNETGIYYLSHPLITCKNKTLFLADNKMSNAGVDIFIADLKKVLNTYLDHNQF